MYNTFNKLRDLSTYIHLCVLLSSYFRILPVKAFFSYVFFFFFSDTASLSLSPSVAFINYSLTGVQDAQNVPILHSVRLYILIRARLL